MPWQHFGGKRQGGTVPFAMCAPHFRCPSCMLPSWTSQQRRRSTAPMLLAWRLASPSCACLVGEETRGLVCILRFPLCGSVACIPLPSVHMVFAGLASGFDHTYSANVAWWQTLGRRSLLRTGAPCCGKPQSSVACLCPHLENISGSSHRNLCPGLLVWGPVGGQGREQL